MSIHLEPPLAENSDYELRALLVGEDGVTPIDEDVVEAIHMTIRDVTGGVLIEPDRDVLAGLLPAVVTDPNGDYNFATPFSADDNRVIEASGEMQLRLVTLKVTHSEGKKRNQEFTYHLDAMQDVEDTVIP